MSSQRHMASGSMASLSLTATPTTTRPGSCSQRGFPTHRSWCRQAEERTTITPTMVLVPPAIRRRDVAIDFKAGSSAFVVGPGSIRPDGKTYRILRGHIGVELPRFEDRERSPLHLVGKRRIEVGQRNSILWQRAIQYAPLADDYDGLLADLAALRNIEFEDPASVPDSEIVKVADWAWKRRLEGRLWAGRNSEVKINRLVLDALLPLPCGSEAYSLYSLLIANHGHRPAKPFAVVPNAIKSAGLLKIGRRQLYRAIDLLLELRLLTKVRQGGGVGNPSLYRLQSPTIALTSLGKGGRVYSITSSSLLPPLSEGTASNA